MIRSLKSQKEKILEQFFQQVEGKFQPNAHRRQEQMQAWKSQGLNYSTEALQAGLMNLKNIHISDQQIEEISQHFKNHRYLASENDPLIRYPEKFFAYSKVSRYPKGHLPFLDYPEILKSLL